jgi:MYXO-CTERM domain-containing protein
VCGFTCVPLTACPAGDDCGTVPDGCGGMVNCGACNGSQTCSNNQCVATIVDSGATQDSGAAPLDSGSVQVDSGSVRLDSGSVPLDSGGGMPDSGSAPLDSGSGGGLDSTTGTGFDSGSGVAVDSGEGVDSGVLADAGTVTVDSGARRDDASVVLKDSGGDAQPGGDDDQILIAGCGCRTAKPAPTSTPAMAGFGALSLLLLVRRRRRRGVDDLVA